MQNFYYRLRRYFSILSSMLSDILQVLKGFRFLRKNGYTPTESMQAMINLFCRTQGISNEIFHFFIRVANPPKKMPSVEGVLGFSQKDDVVAAADQIRKNGYCVFENVIPELQLKELYNFGTKEKGKVRPLEDKGPNYKLPEKVISLKKPRGHPI